MKSRGIVLGLLLLSAPASAGPRDLLVQMGSVGGTTETAAAYVEMFLRYAEAALKWPAGASKGSFFPDPNGALDYIGKQKPGFAMMDPEIWLELRKKEDLKVLAAVHGKGIDRGKLYLVVKGDTFKTVEDLKGKTLVSNHLNSKRYISKIVFDGKIDVATHFRLVPATSPAKGIKALERGEAEATLIDDDQLAESKSAPSAAQFRVIHTSPALPSMPLVAFGKIAKKDESAALAKMVLTMCADPKGAEVCKSLRVTKFDPPDQKAIDDAIKRFEK